MDWEQRMGGMDRMQLRAMAKINLGLDVLRRREDGYHEVRMIMQTVGIYDQLELQATRKPGIAVETNLSYLPVNENNLVYQAAKLLMDEFSVKSGIHITLRKFIPVAAGMAGGSSDGAAMLRFLRDTLSPALEQEELERIAEGADRWLMGAAGIL